MGTFDISILVNWIASGFIGLIFGIISAWVTYRYDRKRDDIGWAREKEKLEQQFNQSRQMSQESHKYDEINLKVKNKELELRVQELESQLNDQQRNSIRDDLLKGVDRFAETRDELMRMQMEQRMWQQRMQKERSSMERAYRDELDRDKTLLLSKLPQAILSFILASILLIIDTRHGVFALVFYLILQIFALASSRYFKSKAG